MHYDNVKASQNKSSWRAFRRKAPGAAFPAEIELRVRTDPAHGFLDGFEDVLGSERRDLALEMMPWEMKKPVIGPPWGGKQRSLFCGHGSCRITEA
jgi:hypothetical protein